MQKSFIAVLAVVVIGMVGLFVFLGKDKETVDPEGKFPYTENVFEVQEHDRKKGEGEIVVIEYGDFQCPFCGDLFPQMQLIEQAYGEEITFVFRHQPIKTAHPNAMAAHRAAEAAGMQGKFFEMHDLIYQNQDEWSSSSSAGAIFEKYAEQLSLDVEKFKVDVASSDAFDKIQSDQSVANKIGATSTPTVFVNGQKVEEPSFQTIAAAIEAILNPEANQETPAEDEQSQQEEPQAE